MNYWYTARLDEMFLDLDSRRALRRAVSVLLVAMRKEKLPVHRVFIYPTKQDGHYHMIITLSELIPRSLKFAWLMWMGNDRLRMAYVMARWQDTRVCSSGDLLVSPAPYHRFADAVCRCRRKHKEDAVTRGCGAMRSLLGEARSADYFARTGERRVKPLRVRIKAGEVSPADLRRWLKAR